MMLFSFLFLEFDCTPTGLYVYFPQQLSGKKSDFNVKKTCVPTAAVAINSSYPIRRQGCPFLCKKQNSGIPIEVKTDSWVGIDTMRKEGLMSSPSLLPMQFHQDKLYSISVYLSCLHSHNYWVRVCFLSRICCYKIYKLVCYFSILSLCVLILESGEIRTIRLKISATAVDFFFFKIVLSLITCHMH